LVRKICVHCKEDYQIKESEMVLLQKLMGQEYMSVKFKHGRGCAYCHQTGYRGRTGVYELLEMNLAMIEALQAKNPVEFSRQAAIALKGKLLINDALKVAVNGITTLSEVVRVAGDGG
jgi:MSHA biogenesis protein MshE